MDLDETRSYASEYTMNMLCGGDRHQAFYGLGATGRYLVRMAAQEADENAKQISTETTRTADKFEEMENKVVREFVSSIVGFGETKRTAIEAAAHLVDQVWNAYIEWAQASKRIVSESGVVIQNDPNSASVKAARLLS